MCVRTHTYMHVRTHACTYTYKFSTLVIDPKATEGTAAKELLVKSL